ncbi:hypothetical protein TNCV_2844811 [Trichonephila clavipes]|nr:hypothetical protein TNCV_2844811 [Trichonephila clavipes]
MQSLHPKPPKHHNKRPVLSIQDCWKQHMFFFVETCYVVPFQQPYDGPFKVLQRKDKVFLLDINGKRVSVSIDRCKTCLLSNTEDFQLHSNQKQSTCYCGTLMQQLSTLLQWNMIQRLQALPQPSTRFWSQSSSSN